jgi:hypothetical protein
VFFTSYAMMTKMEQRWKQTGLWATIEKYKLVVMESKGSQKVWTSPSFAV